MDTKELEKTELQETIEDTKELVLHNDDYNTFDHVIDCLVRVCRHELTQAEQCAYIVHYSGKCIVKKGAFSKLEPLLYALKIQNLTVEIR